MLAKHATQAYTLDMQYLYKPLLRPAAFAGLPAGWDYVEIPLDLVGRRDLPLSSHKHGVIAYTRKLTEDEVRNNDLAYMGPQAGMLAKDATQAQTGGQDD
jgi:hypothetical protein